MYFIEDNVITILYQLYQGQTQVQISKVVFKINSTVDNDQNLVINVSATNLAKGGFSMSRLIEK